MAERISLSSSKYCELYHCKTSMVILTNKNGYLSCTFVLSTLGTEQRYKELSDRINDSLVSMTEESPPIMGCLHSKKEKVTLTLLRLFQLQPNDTMSLPIELPFLLYLIACVQCAGYPQSITRVMFAMAGT